MNQTDLSDLSATVIPIRKNVIDTFAKETNLLYARHENGSIYVSNGNYILKTNQTGLDYLIQQVNKRKRVSDIAVTENKRILDYVKKAKGTFELTQKPYELELHKGCTACFYADEKQYFEYNKKFVDILKNFDNRLFVDDNAGYDVYSHSLIAKGRDNEVLGIALPLTVPDEMYEKLANILPLKVKRKSDIERIKENPTNDPYIGKEFSDGRNNYIISAVRNYGDADMYVVSKIENGKVSRSADLVKVDEIEEQITHWGKSRVDKKPKMAEQMANAAKQAVKYNADRPTVPVPTKNKKAQSVEL